MDGDGGVSRWAGERDLAGQGNTPATAPFNEGASETAQTAGWHLKEGTLRYFDGASWTKYIAPPPELSSTAIAGAVCAGVLAAFFIIWLGVPVSPEHIYLPVKFVVKELPSAFGH